MIPSQRHLFDIPNDIAYLNCAYIAPMLRSAAEAAKTGVERKLYPWQIHAEDFFNQTDEFRSAAAQLFHCEAADVAVIPSAGFGIATAALNVPVGRGQKILVLEEQFPSNLYPWRTLAKGRGAEVQTVPWPGDGNWTSAVLRELRPDVAIAALPQTHWTSGGTLDLKLIAEQCRRNSTALVLDVTQSLGVQTFDINQVQPDFAVAAAYKWLLGPYSLAVMYVSKRWQQGHPLEENWIQRANAEDFSGLVQYTDKYLPGARRLDVGERSNFALLPAAIKAIEQLLDWGIQAVCETIAAHNRYLADQARGLGFQPVIPDQHRAPHYLCLRSEHVSPGKLAQMLAQERVYVSVRGSSVRITPHVYNSREDLDKLIHVLGRAKD